jgi:hypothetical protein
MLNGFFSQALVAHAYNPRGSQEAEIRRLTVQSQLRLSQKKKKNHHSKGLVEWLNWSSTCPLQG